MTPSRIPVSFEFFPPNTPEGLAKLRETRRQLAALEPEFFSVTFGAGGSTRDKSLGVVDEIATEGHSVAPHLSCVGATREGIAELLEHWRAHGVRRLVALRGDLPSGMVDAGEFRYASDLVAFVRERTGDWFRIEVAAYPEMHPQAASPAADLSAFVHKVRAGADAAITQYFFNADAYFRFVDAARAQGVTVPIVPGIMPITNYTQIARFSDACGAEIPRRASTSTRSTSPARAARSGRRFRADLGPTAGPTAGPPSEVEARPPVGPQCGPHTVRPLIRWNESRWLATILRRGGAGGRPKHFH
jgi:methylenetetrahydrofolate reductase (NADPH)